MTDLEKWETWTPEQFDAAVKFAYEMGVEAGLKRAEAALSRVKEVHAEYFDMDAEPWDAQPEPEDVWRYDRDFRAALTKVVTDGAAEG